MGVDGENKRYLFFICSNLKIAIGLCSLSLLCGKHKHSILEGIFFIFHYNCNINRDFLLRKEMNTEFQSSGE